MDPQNDVQAQAPQVEDEDDVEGHAFQWAQVVDKDGKKRLRAGWTPDEPAPGGSRSISTGGKDSPKR